MRRVSESRLRVELERVAEQDSAVGADRVLAEVARFEGVALSAGDVALDERGCGIRREVPELLRVPQREGGEGAVLEVLSHLVRSAKATAAENAAARVDLEVIPTAAMTVEEGAAAGTRILARPRREWPDALVASNDLLALGLLQSLVSGDRMLVPEEIAIIGFDDIPFAGAAAVPLSSIRQPSRMIGRTALRIVLEEASDPDSTPPSDRVPTRARHTSLDDGLICPTSGCCRSSRSAARPSCP